MKDFVQFVIIDSMGQSHRVRIYNNKSIKIEVRIPEDLYFTYKFVNLEYGGTLLNLTKKEIDYIKQIAPRCYAFAFIEYYWAKVAYTVTWLFILLFVGCLFPKSSDYLLNTLVFFVPSFAMAWMVYRCFGGLMEEEVKRTYKLCK